MIYQNIFLKNSLKQNKPRLHMRALEKLLFQLNQPNLKTASKAKKFLTKSDKPICKGLQSHYKDWDLLLVIAKLYLHSTVPHTLKSQEKAKKFLKTCQNLSKCVEHDLQCGTKPKHFILLSTIPW